MDLGREESHLLFLPDLCLCCNIHILVGIMWLSQSWLGAQVGAWTPCDYVRSRAERTSPAFELHRFWLSFTRFSSFPSQVLRGTRILREKKRTHRSWKLRFPPAGFCGARGCSSLSRIVSFWRRESFQLCDKHGRISGFFPPLVPFSYSSCSSQVAWSVSVCSKGEYYFLLVGRRTFCCYYNREP